GEGHARGPARWPGAGRLEGLEFLAAVGDADLHRARVGKAEDGLDPAPVVGEVFGEVAGDRLRGPGSGHEDEAGIVGYGDRWNLDGRSGGGKERGEEKGQ